MYGEVTTTASGATLAVTGLTAGNGMLLAIGLVFAGAAVLTMARRLRKGTPQP